MTGKGREPARNALNKPLTFNQVKHSIPFKKKEKEKV
jgi:hypothetical protein